MTPEQAAALASWRLDAEERPLGAVLDLDDAQAHTTGIGVPHWNGLLLRRAPAGDDLYAEAAAWFAARGMPYGVLVPAGVDARPPGGVLLHEHPVMVRALDGLPPLPDLKYTGAPTAADVVTVQALAFGDEPDLVSSFVSPVLGAEWRRTVVVHEAGAPVATACAVLTEDGALVYDVAVVPAAQRRGLGRAVTLWCLHEAAAAGARQASLNPTPPGRPVYAALGFTDAGPWSIWRP